MEYSTGDKEPRKSYRATNVAVAILTPIYTADLDADSESSVRHLEHYLGDHDRYFLAPESLRPRRHGFEVAHFPDTYFRSVASYSRLMLSTELYRRFQDYEYILIYQLDCLVFSDDLLEWCRSGWDYVGAPWLVDPEVPEAGFARVGNGGFSLRRVESCLRVLGSTRYPAPAFTFLRDLFRAPLPDLAGRASPLRRLRILRAVRRGAPWYLRHYTLNEDRFWSDRARLFDPRFRIASIEEALRFSFERAPRYCFEANGRRLPFGCHAWARWDPRFWKAYRLP